MKYVES